MSYLEAAFYGFTIFSFAYDSWNILQGMIYPDGEEVGYYYDAGGELEYMIGDAKYINNIEYDKFGSRTYVKKGNDTEEQFQYDDMRRLENKALYANASSNAEIL